MEILKQYITEKKKEIKTTISTTIPLKIHTIAKENDIAWNKALEFGILFLKADERGIDYPENKISKRLENVIAQLNAKCQECEALRVQLEGRRVQDEQSR